MVASVDKIVSGMRDNPRTSATRISTESVNITFGPPRTTSGSHAVLQDSLARHPRVTIQNDKGKAKPYQVRQVLAAIDKKEAQ
jgi:hypothetical protein